MFFALFSKKISSADIWETSCVRLRPRFSRKFTFWGLTGIGISAFMAPSEPPFAQGDIKSCERICFAIKEKFLGWDYIIISLYHFIRRTNAMQWYGLDNIHLLYSFHPSSLSDFAKLFSPRAHTQPPHYASTAADNLLAAARVECPGSTDRSSVTQNPSPTAAKFTAKPHILLDTLKKWVSNNFTRSF